MNLEKKMKDYGRNMKIVSDEQRIAETIRKSVDVYCCEEQKRGLSYREFLWTQLRLIRKQWWGLQILLLILLWSALPSIEAEQLMQRILGVAASLFVILIIPELWRNRTCQSMEIEAASYFSLRQIYAARMLLFGMVDVGLITLFCMCAAAAGTILFSQLLMQFLFPMTVTTVICFGILCSKYAVNETTAIMMCLTWNAMWLMIVLNEKIYTAITVPLWFVFFGAAFGLLVLAICRTLDGCNNCWEGKTDEIGIR